MADLQGDKSPGGFQHIGEFHGEPKWCPSPDAEHKFSCCVHGMAVFPHWHRLFTVQAENALRRHGFTGALPYWDWSRPLTTCQLLYLNFTTLMPCLASPRATHGTTAILTQSVKTQQEVSDLTCTSPLTLDITLALVAKFCWHWSRTISATSRFSMKLPTTSSTLWWEEAIAMAWRL